MTKYNTFLILFISSVVAFLFFMAFYLNGIFSIVFRMHEHPYDSHSPFEILSTLFSPAFIVSALVFGIANLSCRILGIVSVAKSKIVTDGEKALWIIGFVILGFITAIVFLVMARGKKFVV